MHLQSDTGSYWKKKGQELQVAHKNAPNLKWAPGTRILQAYHRRGNNWEVQKR